MKRDPWVPVRVRDPSVRVFSLGHSCFVLGDNNFLYNLFTVLPGQAQVWRSEHAEDPMSGPDLSQAQKPGHPQHHTA
jgi:hypothetical protein